MKPVVFHHDYAQSLPQFVVPAAVSSVVDPQVVVFNKALGAQLGLSEADVVAALAQPGHAMAYAGHQFGQFVPVLGDGRAMLLGEVAGPAGLVDVHAKGIGRTAFSRGGSDGLAALKPMLREYVISESLHGLGVSTARSLAVISTGGVVQRDVVEPGAIVVRIAASHVRVGTFQWAALRGVEHVQRLADWVIARHYPGRSYDELFVDIVDAQVKTVAQWMRLGFVHGVINTDNTTVSGESMDFGPCAFSGSYDPDVVFSSIDTAGRYRFGNQPVAVRWNLTRLAESLAGLIDIGRAQSVINDFQSRFREAFRRELAAGLGVPVAPETLPLIDDFRDLMATGRWDLATVINQLTYDGGSADFDSDWLRRWRSCAPDTAMMARTNPVYIPRNHVVEAALADTDVLDQVLPALTDPFHVRTDPDLAWMRSPDPDGFEGYRTFCGT